MWQPEAYQWHVWRSIKNDSFAETRHPPNKSCWMRAILLSNKMYPEKIWKNNWHKLQPNAPLQNVSTDHQTQQHLRINSHHKSTTVFSLFENGDVHYHVYSPSKKIITDNLTPPSGDPNVAILRISLDKASKWFIYMFSVVFLCKYIYIHSIYMWSCCLHVYIIFHTFSVLIVFNRMCNPQILTGWDQM